MYVVVGVAVVFIGLYGLLNPESGRAWGGVRMWEENPESAKELTITANRMVSVLVVLLGFALVVLALTQ